MKRVRRDINPLQHREPPAPVHEPKPKKKGMTISGAKEKGKRLQKWVCKKLTELTGIEHGKDCLIESREMGIDGCDVKLYGLAKEKFPFAIECKNQEQWAMPQFIKQAKANTSKDLPDWILFLSKNYQQPVVVMEADAFFDLYERYLNLLFGADHKVKLTE